MDELKAIIAENIQSLRRDAAMTQAALAEKLNYTDKAVSKWERGESVPDVAVLRDIADLFGVTVDYLLRRDHVSAEDPMPIHSKKRRLSNHASITCMSILLVWLIATFAFVLIDIIAPETASHWLAFVYAVPASMIVWLIFNSIWFCRRRNFLIISLLMWTVLASFYLTLLPFNANLWQIFGLGVPGQAIIFLWSRLKSTVRHPDNTYDNLSDI